MKKMILQAVLFSIIIHVLIIGFPIAKGYLITRSHSPSIANHYENVYMLQNEVAFGIAYNSGGAVLLILSFLVGVPCFMIGKFVIVRLVSKGLKR
jgi:lipoprotein signal peptidase